MAGEFKARDIREEQAFKDAKSKLRHSAKRLDDILFGVTWVIARKPESFPKIPGLDLYVAKTDASLDAPALYIWFTFDSTVVSLLLIEEVPEPE
jgi:hypothetical protein